jgi:hypothetical protein
LVGKIAAPWLRKKIMSALRCFLTAVLLAGFTPLALLAQSAPETPPQPPVSYASVSQVNTLLGNLQQASQSIAVDLAKLRIDKWKTDSSVKKQAQGDVESLSRNVQDAMPGLIDAVRNSPEDIAATFKLYHNLDALHDVLSSVAETAGAFGPREQYQPLANDANNIDSVRRDLANRIQSLAANKEAELNRLRAALTAAQAAPPPPPKKTVIDDTEPAKPVAKKKKPKTVKPPSGQAAPPTTPPAQASQPQ